jgi:hypothetical protein
MITIIKVLLKKKSVFIILLSIISCICKGQDTIVKVNGEQIIAKIILVDIDKIQFKKFENLNGPAYNLLMTEVSVIKYENGTKDFFRTKKIEESEIIDIKEPKPDDVIEKHGWDYYYKGEKISKMRLRSVIEMHSTPEIYNKFNVGYQIYVAGTVVGAIGIGCALIGVIAYTTKMQTGLLSIYTGIGVLALGIPISFAGSAIIEKGVNRYNKSINTSSNPKLTMGLNNNGVGLTLKF